MDNLGILLKDKQDFEHAEPFIRDEDLENITLSGVEMNMPFAPWYDDFAQTIEMHPGDMMHWPLNAPHRVDNADCVNVSVTLADDAAMGGDSACVSPDSGPTDDWESLAENKR